MNLVRGFLRHMGGIGVQCCTENKKERDHGEIGL